METVRGWYQTWCDFPQPKKVKIIKGAAFVCFSFFLLFLVIYAFGGTGKKSKTLTPTVVFMEAMPADLQTLRYLAQRRDVSIGMVILTVSGSSKTKATRKRSRSTTVTALRPPMRLFSNVSFTAGVPVPASTTSCTYRRVFTETLSTNAQRLFNGAALLDLVDVQSPQSRLTYYDAPLSDYLSSRQANFLVLGPATDAAAFLQNHPQRRSQVVRIVMGGGALIGLGDVQYLYPDNRSTSPTTEAEVTSANVVGCPAGYYNQVGSSTKPVSLALLAGSLLADAYLQDGSTVSSVPVNVIAKGNLDVDGRSYRPPSGDLTVNVVLSVNQDTFSSHLLRVDALSFE
ncbi:uncharacterized protein LOC126766974 [Bactrocera neohumeralis]|uniref:uncharacterized protein LOC126766974 n=1 Tax=Bactrocera neohumeralis TaxID=98809 RepID=UPI00216510CC|nr:uncharacterized protein LOC126766974 [Bactrocera neohumeralis]